MKILQVVDFYKPSWEAGGITRVCYELSKRLADKEHEVTVYAMDGFKTRLNVPKNKPVDVDGIPTYYFRNVSNLLTRNNFYTPYFLPFIAKKEMKKFDVIHIHTYRSTMAIFVCYYARKYGIPYVLQAHGSVLPFFAKPRLKRLFDKAWGNKILKDASKVIALTKTEAEQYKKMGVDENRIEIVPNGIDLSEYENLPVCGEFRRKYGIKSDKKIVLYLGRIHKSKGIDLLIDAFLDISKELDDIKLVLIGPNDGNQQSLIKRTQKLEINDKILFTGFVTVEEKKAAFVDADVFVTPRFSGFPITFLEACACGMPIITTNNGDKLDWIHDKVGYVVEYDKEQLWDAMLKMLSDDGVRRRFGEEGRKLVRDQFEWGKIIKQLEDLYLCCFIGVKYEKTLYEK